MRHGKRVLHKDGNGHTRLQPDCCEQQQARAKRQRVNPHIRRCRPESDCLDLVFGAGGYDVDYRDHRCGSAAGRLALHGRVRRSAPIILLDGIRKRASAALFSEYAGLMER
jgi:hypothetical protein